MSDTIVGGAYQDAGGKGWHNAAGEPLDAAQIRAARKLAGMQDDEHAAAEHELAEQSTARQRSSS